MMQYCCRRGWIITAGLLCLAGCCGGGGDQPEVGRVTGKVTMDSEPLSKALVLFGPTSGRTSMGITDDKGEYVLTYVDNVKGAKIGNHTVSITTYHEDEDSQEALSAKEVIPSKYNSKTILKTEVKSGSNVIDFPLESK